MSLNKNGPETFLSTYYTALLKTPSTLSSLFGDNATLTLSHEKDTPQVYRENFHQAFFTFYRKKISKILIITYQTYPAKEMTGYMVIGQIVYEDMENIRFVETLLVDDLIVSSSVIVLDEEISYKEERKKEFFNTLINNSKKCLFVRKGGKLAYKNVIEAFGCYGKIVAYEKRDEDAFIEFDTFEAVEEVLKDSARLVAEKGVEVDRNRVYEKKIIY